MGWILVSATAAFLLAMILWVIRRSRIDRRRADEARTHTPHAPRSGFDRKEHIQKGGLGPRGLER
ncbi:MAG: hypothetical protein AAFU80_00845 [Pseudomonadota bacterium]